MLIFSLKSAHVAWFVIKKVDRAIETDSFFACKNMIGISCFPVCEYEAVYNANVTGSNLP
jgi:hypothetical protein